jgi:hypothetical protein
VIVKVRKEHIAKGIEKYGGVRQADIEQLFAQGKLKAKVYRFEDGRMLVHYLAFDNALLYSDEESLMDAIILE